MRQHVSESLEVSRLELFHRASTHGDLQAWATFQQGLEETVLIWLHEHPGSEAACRMHSEWHFVTLAFERLRQAAVQGQVTCETLSEVLLYLRASLNGAILDALRVSSGPRGVSSSRPDVEEHLDSNEVWDRLQALLSSERERRLAYLLYHCGLQPAEIVRCCPQEWSNVHEVARLRRIIFMRLMKGLVCEGHTFVYQDRSIGSCTPILSVFTEVKPKDMKGFREQWDMNQRSASKTACRAERKLRDFWVLNQRKGKRR